VVLLRKSIPQKTNLQPAAELNVMDFRYDMLDKLIIQFVPSFEEHWAREDIHRKDDGSYTEHGVMGSFLEFYYRNYESISILEISTLCIEFENIVAADPEDKDLAANAICTMFLELLVDTPPGNKIERYLGEACKKYWNVWRF
jgi:hypothetical protein